MKETSRCLGTTSQGEEGGLRRGGGRQGKPSPLGNISCVSGTELFLYIFTGMQPYPSIFLLSPVEIGEPLGWGWGRVGLAVTLLLPTTGPQMSVSGRPPAVETLRLWENWSHSSSGTSCSWVEGDGGGWAPRDGLCSAQASDPRSPVCTKPLRRMPRSASAPTWP